MANDAVASSGSPPGPKPYVAAQQVLAELTLPAVLAGAVLGIVFGASSVYLVLRVGLTVSASIPVAVIAITLFRGLTRLTGQRSATILENNIVQTTGSAGESIAFGIGVTMPALLLLGFEMDQIRVMTVSALGGLLGVLLMIPLRRAFIVEQHGKLAYPEGTACAEVLIAGDRGGASARMVFLGFGLAFVYKCLMNGMRLWKDTLGLPLYSTTTGQGLKKGVLSGELAPELLGVGFILGPRIASIMCGGGVLAYLVLVPTIALVGEGLDKPLYPSERELIRDMSVSELREKYILFIGAGAVATGGIISMARALPLILASIAAGLGDLFGRRRPTNGNGETPRTERDLPMGVVVFGSLGLVAAIAGIPQLGLGFTPLGLAAAGLIVLLGFLFATVSSRLTGEVGSSSNPISGMTVATLLLTCLVFVLLGRTDKAATLTALTVAAVVCIAASVAGATSQDLKTGFLVGATPSKQQWAILIGALSSAFVMGAVLLGLNDAGTVYSKKKENLPNVKLTDAQLAELTRRERAGKQYADDPREYRVWHLGEAEALTRKVPAGKYLVGDDAKPAYFVDPAVNGRLRKWDDGTDVRTNKFEAPKTQLMAKIIDGILNQKLPWGLVLIGVLIAITLEMAGVPSLPFAVGVYLPLESSTPIFVGGMLRFFVNRRQAARGASAAETETAPSTLLATGYIAGGTLAGVITAFIIASPPLSKTLATWRFREVTLEKPANLDDVWRATAAAQSGGQPNPALAREIADLNQPQLSKYIALAAGQKLNLPNGSQATVAQPELLGDSAARLLGERDKAEQLFDLNDDTLKLPTALPAGAILKLPQPDWPALSAAGMLIVILLAVGLTVSARKQT